MSRLYGKGFGQPPSKSIAGLVDHGDLRIRLGLDPVGRRDADRAIRDALGSLSTRVCHLASDLGIGQIGDPLVDVLDAIEEHVRRSEAEVRALHDLHGHATEDLLRAEAERDRQRARGDRWQAMATEMAGIRDDFARLLAGCKHSLDVARTERDAHAAYAADWHEQAIERSRELRRVTVALGHARQAAYQRTIRGRLAAIATRLR